MGDNNRTIMEKADIAVSDLITNGGFNEEMSKTFIRGLQETPTLIRDVRVIPMGASQYTAHKIGIGTRVLHGAPAEVVGTTLDAVKRTAPTTSKVVLNTKEVMAEVHIPYDVLEDNIEGDNLGAVIMSMVMEKAALDLEELILNGDTTIPAATDDLLCKCDGIFKRATAHVLDHTGTPVPVSLTPFADMLKAMPNKYLRNLPNMGFYVSPHAQMDYSTWLSTRNTNLGDMALVGTPGGIPCLGGKLKPCATIANTKSVFLDPKNVLFGIQRNISVETDKDIRSRVLIMVLTMRIDVQVEETDAIVVYKGLNVT